MPTVRDILDTWAAAKPMVYVDNGQITRVFIDPIKLVKDAPELLDKTVVETYSWKGSSIPLLKLTI